MNAEIRYLGDPARHFWLTRSVARAMGLSLYDAMATGALSAPDYAELVTTCRRCPNVGACEAWLAACRPGLCDAPEHCLNAEALERLRHRKSA